MALRTRTASFTRPADATAYAANDVIADSSTSNAAKAMVFPNVRGTLKRVLWSKSTATIANTIYNLFLYSSDPGGALTDNVALGQTLTTPNNLIGVVVLGVGVIGYGAGVDPALGYAVSITELAAAAQIPIDVAFGQAGAGNVGSQSGSIYGVLTATAAYAPGTSEVFSVALHFEPTAD